MAKDIWYQTGARTGERLGTCHGAASDVRMGSFSPDSSMVLVVSQAQIREKTWRFQELGTYIEPPETRFLKLNDERLHTAGPRKANRGQFPVVFRVRFQERIFQCNSWSHAGWLRVFILSTIWGEFATDEWGWQMAAGTQKVLMHHGSQKKLTNGVEKHSCNPWLSWFS